MPGATKEKASGPLDRLKAEAGGLVGAVTDHAMSSLRGKVDDMTSRLTDFAQDGGGPGLMAAITGARDLAEGKSPARSMMGAAFSGVKEKVSGMFGGKGKGKDRGKKKLKLTNIVESIDVGVPLRLAYDQWNQFNEFPTFMKKVDNAERTKEPTKLNWKAQVFWSHRSWESTIVDQRPDERIIWHSKGQKGHVDGAVTFHELGPRLTRIVVVLEYHPQGMFERTGNIWRAQGRRVRLELKHFARHTMINSVLKADEIEGWRGVIEDSEVVLDHEEALEQESREREEGTGEREGSQAGERGAQEPADEAGGDEEAEESEETDGAGRGRRGRRRTAGKAAEDEEEDEDEKTRAQAGEAGDGEAGEGDRADGDDRHRRRVPAQASRGRRRTAGKAADNGDEDEATRARAGEHEDGEREDGDGRQRRTIPAQASRGRRRPASAARGGNRK